MNISEEYLYHRLEEIYPIERMGKILHSEHLPIPCFYQMNEINQEGGVYITQVRNLPKSPAAHSLFICVGNYPPTVWSNWGSEIIYIDQKNGDIFQVFNTVQTIYQQIGDWERRMEELLNFSGDIGEMTRCSMDLLNNRICVADYKFSILAHCRAAMVGSRRKMEMVNDYERIPFDITAMFRQNHSEFRDRREPFFIETHEADITWRNYCIPLYVDGEYVGACALTEEGREITASEQLLFRRFADYIARTLDLHSDQIGSAFVSMRTIFTDLLNNIPISHHSLTEGFEMFRQRSAKEGNPHSGRWEAPEKFRHNGRLEAGDKLRQSGRWEAAGRSKQNSVGEKERNVWTCMVLRSANREKDLPAQYICETLEGILPRSIAFMYEESIVLFRLHPEAAARDIRIRSTAGTEEAAFAGEDFYAELIRTYLEDMNFRMGTSYPFDDLYKARTHYLQAVCALEYGRKHNVRVTGFSDCVLEHMLQSGCSRFEPDELISPGLRKLKNLSGNIDYWDTLKRYLDNECNASKTAEELYLHRSSLLPRLEKIRNYVDLDTPEQRLYLRMCMYLEEV